LLDFYFFKVNIKIYSLFSIISIEKYVIIVRYYLTIKRSQMIAPYFPSILVPIIGIFLPGLAMASLFIYIEKESVE
jgi:photosystem I reaction center subunit VIII